MQIHPLIEQIKYRIIAIFLLLFLFVLHAGLLFYYGEGREVVVLADSVVFLAVFSVLAYFFWYSVGLMDEISNQVGVLLIVQFICIGASYLVVYSIAPESGKWFVRSIPIRFIFGVMAWILLLQWYRWYYSLNSEEVSGSLPDLELENNETEIISIDRISVKDGSRIHLIPIEELVYIQSCGDYVTLFTVDKQYVKEQTMKSLISQLPLLFVRVHRSLIVNSDYITRIELFEKQSYRIRLKSGLYLKVSTSGYKVLKERLRL
ncbi:MAG: LytTR family DNA-binding domain-containing protein [Massilibacteroides sp.]|nr:LytTR family DNA-binding domain-containing protein [Massilibacteroides sp.]